MSDSREPNYLKKLRAMQERGEFAGLMAHEIDVLHDDACAQVRDPKRGICDCDPVIRPTPAHRRWLKE
jgi:hypothetical protein